MGNPPLVSNGSAVLTMTCPYQTFGLDSAYPGRKREIKKQIVDMTVNGSGVRDIARVLRVSTATVLKELKKNSFNLNR